MKRRVVVYIRVSTEEQASRGFSIPAQQQVLRDYAIGHDLEVVEEFVESESAFKPGRPEFQRMIAFLNKRRDVTAVLRLQDRSDLAQPLGLRRVGRDGMGQHHLGN